MQFPLALWPGAMGLVAEGGGLHPHVPQYAPPLGESEGSPRSKRFAVPVFFTVSATEWYELEILAATIAAAAAGVLDAVPGDAAPPPLR